MKLGNKRLGQFYLLYGLDITYTITNIRSACSTHSLTFLDNSIYPDSVTNLTYQVYMVLSLRTFRIDQAILEIT